MRARTITFFSFAFAATMAGVAISAEVTEDDAKFLDSAAQSGLLEIQASQLALKYGGLNQVKDYAGMMLNDHQQMHQQLQALASNKGISLPTEVSDRQRQILADLSKKHDVEFDQQYSTDIAVEAHEDAVELFEDAAENADDTDVKKFAVDTLPRLQAHLSQGQQLRELIQNSDQNKPGALEGDTPAERTEPPQPQLRY